MTDNEDPETPEPPPTRDEDYEPTGGFDELPYALADALRAKRSREAIAALIERFAEEMPVKDRRRFRAMLWSYAFTLLVIATIGVLGWLKIIGSDTASALIGAVIGSIFYRQRPS